MTKSPTSISIGFALSVGVFLSSGCATTLPPKEAIASSRIYGRGYSDVWEAVLASLAERNILVTSMEKESGRIVAVDGTQELRQFEPGRYDSTDCFCGSPERYHTLRGIAGDYTISVIRGNEVRTTVTIDASYRASQYAGERLTGWLPCLSKGIFEPLFLERVGSRLASGEGPSRNVDWWRPSRGY